LRYVKSVREEFEESMKLLLQRDGELKDTKVKLQETGQVLENKAAELETTKSALEEEVVVRKAYQENEVVLDDVAHGLKKTTEQSLNDLDALFAKLCKSLS